jgi:hypothetical protein
MNLSNLFLGCMLLSYSIPIIYVCYTYSNQTTLSEVLCDENCNRVIITSMVIMGIFTILYEYVRNNFLSLLLMSLTLISIYGLLWYNYLTNIHNIFAFLCFASILLFMIHHTGKKGSIILYLIAGLQYLLLLYFTVFVKDAIFIGECLFIILFFCFYIYLHTL